MPKVVCTLENAPTTINGFRFTKTVHGMVSEELPDEDAEHFASIPGYAAFELQRRGPGRPPKDGGSTGATGATGDAEGTGETGATGATGGDSGADAGGAAKE